MIVHFDIDAFYASVAQRDDPTLRGLPLAICHDSRRAVVLTASYEARPFGVRSAMPLYRALEACPQLVVVAPNFEAYREASRAVFAIFADGSRAVEGLSLDEAFVDLDTDEVAVASEFAQRVRKRVADEVGVTVSAGVSAAKIVAKIASDACKPDGLAVVAPGTEAEYLAPLDVGRLWGVGPKSRARLQAAGVMTIGELAALGDAQAYALFGRAAREMRNLALGIDARAVESERETRSVSTESTFEHDIRDGARLAQIAREQSVELAERLSHQGLYGSTIGIKIKRGDFTTIVRQTSLAQPTNDAAAIAAAALHCLARADVDDTPVRLLGVRAANLSEQPATQIGFSFS